MTINLFINKSRLLHIIGGALALPIFFVVFFAEILERFACSEIPEGELLER